MNKIRVGILFGGKSAEHEVSLQSAKNIINAIDKEKYEVVLMGVDKQGRWLLQNGAEFLLSTSNPALLKLNQHGDIMAMIPESKGVISNFSKQRSDTRIDVVFPVLHGPYGEDGTVQGLLKLVGVPFVGAGVLASAVGMDKDITKRLLRDAGILIARFRVYRKHDTYNFEELAHDLGLPFFVKPANMGSSVGVSKVIYEGDFEQAIDSAFSYDTKILIEEYIDGREIECSVLGGNSPVASVPGEVIPHHEFYSYEAKYIDENGAALEIPARISHETTQVIQGLAIKTFKTLSCEGMARVDFFVKDNGEVLVNEINTIPGFTRISMYPKLWEASGVSYTELIDRLIEHALQRFEREKNIRTSFVL